jgi:hypothetical protein
MSTDALGARPCESLIDYSEPRVRQLLVTEAHTTDLSAYW